MLWPKLPRPEELSAWLRKMEANPGSCIVLTIEPRKGSDRPDVKIAWISEAERKKIRKTLIEVSIDRGRRDEPSLTEPPK